MNQHICHTLLTDVQKDICCGHVKEILRRPDNEQVVYLERIQFRVTNYVGTLSNFTCERAFGFMSFVIFNDTFITFIVYTRSMKE